MQMKKFTSFCQLLKEMHTKETGSFFLPHGVYRLLVYIVCSPLSFFLYFFRAYLLPYLSFPLRTDPLRFQAGCRKIQLNLVLVFLCLFCVVVHLFWLVNACFGCVRFSFFLYQAKKLLQNKMTYFMSSGVKFFFLNCNQHLGNFKP